MSSLKRRPWRWAEDGGVLVEHADWDAGIKYAAALRTAGFSVLLCAGPDAEGHGRPSCPLLAGEECALVAGADVVVTALGEASHAGAQVVGALRRQRSRTVVAVEPEADSRAVVRAVREATRLAAA